MAKTNRKGWIKLWRKIMDNDMYFSEPFDKTHAWIDLLLLASYSEKPGTLETSLEALRKRWSWGSRRKVLEHLRTLSGTRQVTLKTSKDGTLITIEKWGFYQDFGKPKNKVSGTRNGTPGGTQEEIYKEEGLQKSEILQPPEDENDDWLDDVELGGWDE